jgi:hypothetical protein
MLANPREQRVLTCYEMCDRRTCATSVLDAPRELPLVEWPSRQFFMSRSRRARTTRADEGSYAVDRRRLQRAPANDSGIRPVALAVDDVGKQRIYSAPEPVTACWTEVPRQTMGYSRWLGRSDSGVLERL